MPPPAVARRLACPEGLESAGLNVWLFALDLADGDLAALSALLDHDEREQAAGYRYAVHRDRFVARRGWLRRILADETGTAPDALRFARGPYGKPFLRDAGAIGFSVSSAGALGLCVTARDAEIGCDIAELDSAPCDLAVAERYFHASEHRAILALPAENRKAAFLNCWTRKEAYVKALGYGLNVPLNSFAVSIGAETCPQLYGGMSGYALHSLALKQPYHAAIAIRRTGKFST